nr:RNA polymerase II subunit RPB3 [Andalucia godoyi]|eukprot:ANDGO_01812.mRNA.1 DNA-directed RNA polymerase II subunit rpb3
MASFAQFGRLESAPPVIIHEMTDARCVFDVNNVDLSLANALRRSMIAEVATMTIDHVDVIENSSILFDEFIAHRLGLVPLAVPHMEQFTDKTSCSCFDGCDHCCIVFELRAGFDFPPSTASAEGEELPPIRVTARDLKPISNTNVGVFLAGDSDPGIEIMRLKRGQRLHLKCIAYKGVGKVHAKWSPVGTARFVRRPVIKLNESSLAKLEPEDKEAIAASCPSRVFAYVEESDKLVVERPDGCTFCRECLRKSEEIVRTKEAVSGIWRQRDRALLTVGERRDANNGALDVQFDVESTGSMPAVQIVRTGLSVLSSKIANIRAHFEAIVPQ